MITIDSFVIGDEPDAWRAAGFAVDGSVTWLGDVRLEFAGKEGGRGIRSWALRGCSDVAFDGSIDGLPTVRAVANLDSPATRPVHPNGTTAIDHVVVATPSFSRTIAALGAAGFVLRRERETGNYGGSMRQGFFRAGAVIIEVVGPSDAGNDGDGDAGFYGLALTVADLDATARHYGDALGDVKGAVQEGRRIATLRHRQLHLSTAIAFMSPEPAQLA